MDLTALLRLEDFESCARAAVDPAVWAYVSGGAGAGRTVRANAAAYDDVWLVPRVLGVAGTAPELGMRLLGHSLSMPVLLAPTSPQRLLHEDAELATAQAAAATGTVAIVSTDS